MIEALRAIWAFPVTFPLTFLAGETIFGGTTCRCSSATFSRRGGDMFRTSVQLLRLHLGHCHDEL